MHVYSAFYVTCGVQIPTGSNDDLHAAGLAKGRLYMHLNLSIIFNNSHKIALYPAML